MGRRRWRRRAVSRPDPSVGRRAVQGRRRPLTRRPQAPCVPRSRTCEPMVRAEAVEEHSMRRASALPPGRGGSSVEPLGAHSLARRAAHRRASKPAVEDASVRSSPRFADRVRQASALSSLHGTVIAKSPYPAPSSTLRLTWRSCVVVGAGGTFAAARLAGRPVSLRRGRSRGERRSWTCRRTTRSR